MARRNHPVRMSSEDEDLILTDEPIEGQEGGEEAAPVLPPSNDDLSFDEGESERAGSAE